MDQAKSGLRLPVLAAVDRTASRAAMAGGGVESSQDLQQLLTGISGISQGLVQALPALIGAFL